MRNEGLAVIKRLQEELCGIDPQRLTAKDVERLLQVFAEANNLAQDTTLPDDIRDALRALSEYAFALTALYAP